jgi:putative inorganic carbon (hco3(-)) transporter
MRDLIVLGIVLGSVPVCLFRPYYGVLLWVWIAYFNPHRFTWSYAYDFPVAMVIAIPTLIGLFFTRDMNKRFVVRESVLLFFLWVWYLVSLFWAMRVPLFAGHIADATAEMTRVDKILLMTVVMILLVTTQKKLKYLVMVTALSFGVLALKGAAFGLATGGSERIWGPPESFIADNNAFGLALNMTLPMFFFLAREEKNKYLRRLLYAAFLASIFCIIFSYSRGALLGLITVLSLLSLKSRYKVASVVAFGVAALVLLTFAPDAWMTRMGNFANGNLDGSAQQRLVTWETGWHFVKDYPIAGGSFDTLPDPEVFRQYQLRPMPGGFEASGPHSIYFQTLSEGGFVGLAIFIALILSTLLSLRRIRNQARRIPSANWLVPYTEMFQIGLLGFLVSGAFLGLAHFDLFYQFIACTVIMTILMRKEIAAATTSVPASIEEPAPEPELAEQFS